MNKKGFDLGGFYWCEIASLIYPSVCPIPCKSTQFRAIHTIPCNTMQFRAITCNSNQFHARKFCLENSPIANYINIHWNSLSEERVLDLRNTVLQSLIEANFYKIQFLTFRNLFGDRTLFITNFQYWFKSGWSIKIIIIKNTK